MASIQLRSGQARAGAIIVADFIEGIRLKDLLANLQSQGDDYLRQLEQIGIDHRDIGRRLVRGQHFQVHECPFFHADPHPGNIVVQPGGRIAVNVANLGRRPYRSLAADVTTILQEDLRLLLRGEVVWVKQRGAAGNCAWGSFQRPGNPVLRDLTERVIIASKGRFDRAWIQPSCTSRLPGCRTSICPISTPCRPSSVARS